jgi:hypothetical protein
LKEKDLTLGKRTISFASNVSSSDESKPKKLI